MSEISTRLAVLAICILLTGPGLAAAQTRPASPAGASIPPELVTPDKVESSLGTRSTTVYFGPTQPAGVEPGNWIQTVPGKGWFTILRLYSPLESFFTKTWRPSEIALVR